VADAAGKPLSGLRINLEGNMSHAGMTPVFTVARETGAGQYSSTMEFSMAGDWHFMVHMMFPDGRDVDRQFEIKGVQP
jgi:hypothetical protein